MPDAHRRWRGGRGLRIAHRTGGQDRGPTRRGTRRGNYFFFGAAETLLAFRLILKLLGASPASGFVDFIYGVTGIFIAPFEGIFRTAVSQGIETRSVLEPATIVAIVVYTVVAWGIVELVRISSGEKQTA